MLSLHMALLLGVIFASILTRAASVGVCYGMSANNLPPPSTVVGMLRNNGFNSVRLYAPDSYALAVLARIGIGVIVGAPNYVLHVPELAASTSAVATWVRANMATSRHTQISPSGTSQAHSGQRGRRGRHTVPCPSDGEHARRAGRGRAGRRRKGHDYDIAGHHRHARAAVGRRVRGRVQTVPAPRAAVPGVHRVAAPGQPVPILRLHVQGRRRHGRELHVVHGGGDGGAGRRVRVPEHVRRKRGRGARGDGAARGERRGRGGVGDRVAVGGRRGGVGGEREDVQPEPGEPCREGHASAAVEGGDVRVLHVQREPQAVAERETNIRRGQNKCMT
uniref:Uncharacterized protein n=1 Tax=Triticum urartu TaxID=4572 RepID=A0A8R7U0Q1_TRIUA